MDEINLDANIIDDMGPLKQYGGVDIDYPLEIKLALRTLGNAFEYAKIKLIPWQETLLKAYNAKIGKHDNISLKSLDLAITLHESGLDNPESAKFSQLLADLRDSPYPLTNVQAKDRLITFQAEKIPVRLHIVDDSHYLSNPDGMHSSFFFQPIWMPNPISQFIIEEYEKTLPPKIQAKPEQIAQEVI